MLAGRPFLAFAALVLAAGVARAEAPPAPVIPPFEIPAFDGKPHRHTDPTPAMAPAPQVNGDDIFRTIINCYPEKSWFGLELKAVGGLRETGPNNSISTFDTSGLAKHYVGIVAEMPLYSASEIDRERTREMQRRQETAGAIKALLQGLADRRRAQRELSLYTSLEARSQVRVSRGIVEVAEQVGYLEKVAAAQATYDTAVAAIEGARLALVGQCRDEVLDPVNGYLMEVTR